LSTLEVSEGEGRAGVIILTRALFILLALRLLVPPGICLCKLSSPASRLLAQALNSDHVPPVENDDDHHHHDGCPASPLNEGMGLRPAGPGPIDMPLIALLHVQPDDPFPGSPALPVDLSFSAAPRPPLCVSCCALRC
jgi:hypothetical protein